MKLTLVISSLGGGGGERIMLDLARGWIARGYAVHVVTLAAPQADVYPLPAGATRTALDCMGSTGGSLAAPWRGLRRVHLLRRAIRESNADRVIAFMVPTSVLAIMAAAGLRIPVLVYELVAPGVEAIGNAYAMLRRLTYPHAALVLTQTSRGVKGLVKLAPGSVVKVAPGFVPPFALDEGAGPRAPGPPVFLAVGRLTEQKGLDMLLVSFARVARKLPAWRLRIVGSGPLGKQLAATGASMGLADRIDWVPRQRRPWDQATAQTVFVLPSRYEGFPNVLLEAMAGGLAPVAFDCPSGPAEIITNGKNGLLVPANDVEELADAMYRLAADSALRERMATAARDVQVAWSLDASLDSWDSFLADPESPQDRTAVLRSTLQ